MEKILDAGFSSLDVVKENAIEITDELLSQYLSSREIKQFKHDGNPFFSITVVGYKKQM